MSDREAGDSAQGTLASGLRGWLSDGVELLRVRLELLGVEAREHAYTVVELLLLGLAAVILLGLGLGFLAMLLTVLLWDGHRTLALALFTAIFLTLGTVALVWAWVRWRRSQRWFEASLQELRRDERQLRP